MILALGSVCCAGLPEAFLPPPTEGSLGSGGGNAHVLRAMLPLSQPAAGTQSDDFFVCLFVFYFIRGWGWGCFLSVGLGHFLLFPAAPGWGCFVSLANVVFSCTERHSNH